MIRGNHQFGVGGSVAYCSSLSEANVRSPGQFSFGGGNTGIGLGGFVIGCRLAGKHLADIDLASPIAGAPQVVITAVQS